MCRQSVSGAVRTGQATDCAEYGEASLMVGTSEDADQQTATRSVPTRPGPDGVQAGESGGKVGYNQLRRLNSRYRIIDERTIRTRASGYPTTQSNSGMCSKFIP